MQLKIRLMVRKDLNQVLTIENVSFPVPWSRDSFLAEIRNPMAHYYVVEDGDIVVAYAGVWIIFDEAHITNVAVHPEKRGNRIGELLLTRVESLGLSKGVEKLTLEVRPSNLSAISLYKRMGFKQVGLRKGYYSDNSEDALIMTKRLPIQ